MGPLIKNAFQPGLAGRTTDAVGQVGHDLYVGRRGRSQTRHAVEHELFLMRKLLPGVQDRPAHGGVLVIWESRADVNQNGLAAFTVFIEEFFGHTHLPGPLRPGVEDSDRKIEVVSRSLVFLGQDRGDPMGFAASAATKYHRVDRVQHDAVLSAEPHGFLERGESAGADGDV